MPNEIIYKGLRLVTDCKYFQVKEGAINSMMEDPVTSTLKITYSPGNTAKSLSNSLGIPVVGKGDQQMESMSTPSRIKYTYLTINGLKLKKISYGSHIFNMIIVDDCESRVVQSTGYTTIVVSKDDYKNPEFINFLFYSGNLLYLKPEGQKIQGYQIRNFPKILIKDSNITVESENINIYTLRRRYNDYLIRAIDYQVQFLLEIRRILDDYGIELVRTNKETTLSKTSYVTYQLNQTPIEYQHPGRNDYIRQILPRKLPIEFSLHSTDMVLFHDFKNKFINVNLLTNFTEFKTMDNAGGKWSAAVKWGQITEDFNHVYQPDDNSNFALQCQFRCELYFYEVLDTRHEFLKDILTRIEATEK